jgi:hypothetical protein
MTRLAVMGLILFAAFIAAASIRADDVPVQQVTIDAEYQGKTAEWWAKRAVQNRKNSNARGVTIKRLKTSLNHNQTIQECVKLATIAYPDFTEARAWRIIRHESWMTRDPLHAKNPKSTASGLYQFLTSTFASTPYGRAGMSIWSACASSLAAGWMHENGRGREWAIR